MGSFHPGPDADRVNRVDPKMLDQHIGGGVVADLDHRNDQLPDGKTRAVSRSLIKSEPPINSLPRLKTIVSWSAPGWPPLDVRGRHHEHFDHRCRGKDLVGVIGQERGPGASVRAKTPIDREASPRRRRDPVRVTSTAERRAPEDAAAAAPAARNVERFTIPSPGSAAGRRAKTRMQRPPTQARSPA